MAQNSGAAFFGFCCVAAFLLRFLFSKTQQNAAKMLRFWGQKRSISVFQRSKKQRSIFLLRFGFCCVFCCVFLHMRPKQAKCSKTQHNVGVHVGLCFVFCCVLQQKNAAFLVRFLLRFAA